MLARIKFQIYHNVVIGIVVCIITSAGSGINYSTILAEIPPSEPFPSFWYYVDKEKVYLPLATDALAVIFDDKITSFERETISKEINQLVPRAAWRGMEQPEHALVELKSDVSQTELHRLFVDINAMPGVRYVNPVFELPDARLTITDQFIARFKPNIPMQAIEDFNAANYVEIVKATRLPNTFILSVGAGSNTLDVANHYHNSDITVYATPDFVRYLEKQFVPDDTFYTIQWALENTGTNPPDGVGTADADIDATTAWDFTIGDSGTVIAIIDEGVELNHEDLDDKIVGQYTSIPSDSDANPNNTWDAHGTNCAGIAAAETDNSLGVAGVCANCSLLPVQIAYSSSDGGSWITTDSRIADAIIWSVNNGADVLSNSWGGGTPSNSINDAISYAVTNGRDGLGSILLFAAGNADTNAVIYPASNSNTIAVGASSPCDERKNPSSCDGEFWWGSNYGSALDIVAPGVEWVSTDMMGSAGYSNGNYFDHMNGTSSATPAAAGLAGLIISHRPCLTYAQVQDIMQQSADDQVGLSAEDTPGWDQYMGWGRINAYQALVLADGYSCEPEPSYLEVTPANRTVGSAAGTTSFNISSNINWTVTESLSWLSAAPQSGSGDDTLTVTYDENVGTNLRVGTITVSAGALSEDVTVTQSGATTYLEVTPANRTVGSAAGTTSFNISSNISWTVTENLGWLSAALQSGSGDDTLTVTYDENVGTNLRVGTITVSDGFRNVDVLVTQSFMVKMILPIIFN